jgi:hypothetical protein
MSEIAGKLVPLKISFDGGATFKTLVCLQQFDESIDIPIDTQETDCGQVSAPGAPGASVNFTAICQPEPGADQASLNDCKKAAVAGTSVVIEIESPAVGSVAIGAAFYSKYSAYLSNITTVKQTSQAIQFTGTINSTGPLTVEKAP